MPAQTRPLRPQAPRAPARPGAPSPPSGRSPLPLAAPAALEPARREAAPPDSTRRSQGKRRAEQPRGVQRAWAAGPGGRSRGDAAAPGASAGQGPATRSSEGRPCSQKRPRKEAGALRKVRGFTGTAPVSLAAWGAPGGLGASSALCSLGDQGQVLAGQHTCRRAHSRASGAAGWLPQTPTAQPSLPGWDSHGMRPRFFPDSLASQFPERTFRHHEVGFARLPGPGPGKPSQGQDGVMPRPESRVHTPGQAQSLPGGQGAPQQKGPPEGLLPGGAAPERGFTPGIFNVVVASGPPSLPPSPRLVTRNAACTENIFG